jgi:hypothetical protein
MIRLFTLKELKAREIHAELKWVYGQEALAFQTMKKWRRRFYQRRTDLSDDSMSGRLVTNDLRK